MKLNWMGMGSAESFFRNRTRWHILTGLILIWVALPTPGATKTWRGSLVPVWSHGNNWVGGEAPKDGDDLVFPQSGIVAGGKAMVNDLSTEQNEFQSLRFAGSGYTLRGNLIRLRAGINSTRGSGGNTLNCDLRLAADQTFQCDSDVAPPTAGAATLVFNGQINLDGFDLRLEGAGIIVFEGILSGIGSAVTLHAGLVGYRGSQANTYSGTTTITSGLLILNKSQGGAIFGPLVVDGSAYPVVVQWGNHFQIIDPTLPVTVKGIGMLDLNGHVDAIGKLTLEGGTVALGGPDLRPGALRVGGAITVTRSTYGSVIRGPGNLLPDRNANTISIDCQANAFFHVEANVSDGTLENNLLKVGSGSLILEKANSYSGVTYIREGTLELGTTASLGPQSLGITLDGEEGHYRRLVLSKDVAIENKYLRAEGTGNILAGLESTRWGGEVDVFGQLTLSAYSWEGFTVSGAIAGRGELRVDSANLNLPVRLTGTRANTFEGPLIVENGRIELSKSVRNGGWAGDLILPAPARPEDPPLVVILHEISRSIPEQINDRAAVTVMAPCQVTIAALATTAQFSETIGSLAGDGNVTLAFATLITGGNNRQTAFDGVIVGTGGGLVKEGTNVFTLSGANTYDGPTTVSKGTLIINGSQTDSPVTVNDGATLAGRGETGSLAVRGHLDPGDSVGRLTSQGVTFTSSADFNVQLNGRTAGSTHDQLRVQGRVVLNEARLHVTIAYAMQQGDTFTIIDNDGVDAVSGRFAGLSEGETFMASGRCLRISYSGGSGNNDVVLTSCDSVGATTKIWSGAVNGRWSLGSNWVGGLTPRAGDDLVFPAGAVRFRSTNDLAPGLLIQSLRLDAGGYFVTGTNLTLGDSIVSTTSSALNTIALPISLAGESTITVTAGLLELTGLLSGPGGLAKEDAGVLALRGNLGNTYSGNTRVRGGTLRLGKSTGFAISSGQLIIGDSSDNSDTDRVEYASNFELSVNVDLQINSTGLLDLHGFTDDIGNIELRGGDIRTGTNMLQLRGNILARTTGTPPFYNVSTIDGWLDLGANPRTFTTLRPMLSFTETTPLVINALITGPATLSKAGSAALRLNGSNSFTGQLRIDDGKLIAAHPKALGAGAAHTEINTNASLELQGSIKIQDETLVWNSSGNLLSGNGTNEWKGPIHLNHDLTVVVPGVSELTLSEPITGAYGLAKRGVSQLKLMAPNSFAGTTRVLEGVLILDAPAGSALAGHLVVGTMTGTNTTATGTVIARILNRGQLSRASDVVVHREALVDWSDLGGATEEIGSLAGNGLVHLGAARLRTGLNNASTAFDGIISGRGGRLSKAGLGTMTLNGPNTYTGQTSVSDMGKLVANGQQPASPVQVNAGATLGGRGRVGALDSSGGIVAPGLSPGVLTTENLSWNASTTLLLELNGTTGSQFDQLIVKGTVSLGNALFPPPLLGYRPQPGDRFVIIRNDGSTGIVGRFGNWPNDVVISCAGFFRINYQGGDGNDVELTFIGPPASFRVTDTVVGDDALTLCWESVPGQRYRVEQTSIEAGELWSPVADVTATAESACLHIARSRFVPQMFYRVLLLCP